MSEPIIDQTVFSELQDATGADFVADLVSTFLDEAPGMIADLKGAAKAADADAFRRVAHTIKSNANVFGASALANLARRMELEGVQDDAVLSDLMSTYDLTAQALRGMLNE